MLCLGIETSCDETALALVSNGQLLESVIASQAQLHAIFGGVVPELASREHYRFIGPLFDELLKRAGLSASSLDVIAAARGPGLLGSLLVGVAFAKALAFALGRPFIGVNHLQAHLLACGLENNLTYPALGILASGGHTQLYLIASPLRFQELGRTLDDAAGEAFDKTGKALGLDYPAGKRMDELAQQGNASRWTLPRPYLKNDNLDFSFSGLKTAAWELLQSQAFAGKIPIKDGAVNQDVCDFCAAVNKAIAETIIEKARRVLILHPGLKAIWLAGGVAANTLTRQRLKELAKEHGIKFLAPAPSLCADNGAMIAYAAWLLAKKGYYHPLSMATIPRGMAIPEDMLQAPAES